MRQRSFFCGGAANKPAASPARSAQISRNRSTVAPTTISSPANRIRCVPRDGDAHQGPAAAPLRRADGPRLPGGARDRAREDAGQEADRPSDMGALAAALQPFAEGATGWPFTKLTDLALSATLPDPAAVTGIHRRSPPRLRRRLAVTAGVLTLLSELLALALFPSSGDPDKPAGAKLHRAEDPAEPAAGETGTVQRPDASISAATPPAAEPPEPPSVVRPETESHPPTPSQTRRRSRSEHRGRRVRSGRHGGDRMWRRYEP